MRDIDFQVVERATVGELVKARRAAAQRFKELTADVWLGPKPEVTMREWMDAHNNLADAENRLELRRWLVGAGKLSSRRSA